MAIRPSVPEIITVNSEALQTQIRDLLPSQNGFGSELQATNVITPIIDLTAAAEGSGLGSSLQQALSFGSQTAFNVNNTTTDIITSTGWYRVTCGVVLKGASGAAQGGGFDMSDGLSTKRVWGLNENFGGTADPSYSYNVDLIFFNAVGITTSIQASANASFVGSVRQVADAQGALVDPVGFPV
jgi:hypothetical protein